MKRLILIALAPLCGACMLHRTPSLPAPIPHVAGTPRNQFALRSIDVKTGTGAAAESKKCLFVHYTGWLTNGKKFDSSRDTIPGGVGRDPYGFPQGFRRVIEGWDLGFDGMRVGGLRRLFIPYQLAYGEAGRPPGIPAKSELIFDVELMAVADTMPRFDAQPRGTAPTCLPWSVAKNIR